MQFTRKAWLSAVPALMLATACGESPVSSDPGTRRVEVGTAASTASDCQKEIEQLQQATNGVTITGRNAEKDRAGLAGKLSEASSKLSEGKNADAVQKLNDFTAKVQQLKTAGKLDAASADQLTGQANQAISCINNIGA